MLKERSVVYWKKKYSRQGFSYEEVLKEIRRRFEGECVLSATVSKERFDAGLKKLERSYRISAGLNKLLDREKMSHEDLLRTIGVPDDNLILELLIDPVWRRKGQTSLRRDEQVSCYYPGGE